MTNCPMEYPWQFTNQRQIHNTLYILWCHLNTRCKEMQLSTTVDPFMLALHDMITRNFKKHRKGKE